MHLCRTQLLPLAWSLQFLCFSDFDSPYFASIMTKIATLLLADCKGASSKAETLDSLFPCQPPLTLSHLLTSSKITNLSLVSYLTCSLIRQKNQTKSNQRAVRSHSLLLAHREAQPSFGPLHFLSNDLNVLRCSLYIAARTFLPLIQCKVEGLV